MIVWEWSATSARSKLTNKMIEATTLDVHDL